MRAELTVIVNRGCWTFWYPQRMLELGITRTGHVSNGQDRKIGKSVVGKAVCSECKLRKDSRGRAGRKDLGNNEQFALEGSEIGKLA